MKEFFLWFTDMANSKTAAAVIFFVTFIAIVIYVFGSEKRKKQYDDYRMIPFLDDEETKVKKSESEENSIHDDNQNHTNDK